MAQLKIDLNDQFQKDLNKKEQEYKDAAKEQKALSDKELKEVRDASGGSNKNCDKEKKVLEDKVRNLESDLKSIEKNCKDASNLQKEFDKKRDETLKKHFTAIGNLEGKIETCNNKVDDLELNLKNREKQIEDLKSDTSKDQQCINEKNTLKEEI